VLLGHGDGTFGSRTDFGTGDGPNSVAIADLDADGRPDLATAGFYARAVTVLLNNLPDLCPSRPVRFDLSPNALNLTSMGRWVTATLEPQPPATPGQIDIASVRLNGGLPVDASAPTSIGDVDADGRPDLTLKFDRAAVELAVAEGDSVPVTVSGKIGNGCFETTRAIRVIRGHVTAPAADAMLLGGSTVEVRWDTPAGIQVLSAALLWSSDDGTSWTLVAHDLPNNGGCSWIVPSAGTDRARVAVVLVESADETGFDVNGVLGVSDRFVITSPLATNGANEAFALHGSAPNPGTSMSVSFSLPDAEPATLEIYDVGGREIRRMAVVGAGRQVVSLGARGAFAPGIYLVRLVRGERMLVTRTVIVH